MCQLRLGDPAKKLNMLPGFWNRSNSEAKPEGIKWLDTDFTVHVTPL